MAYRMSSSKYNYETRYIYAMIDPRTNIKIAYIGQTVNPKVRFKAHQKLSGENIVKDNWITELNNYGLKPILKIEMELFGTMIDAFKYEMAYTVKYRELGYKILSVSDEKIGSLRAYIEV